MEGNMLQEMPTYWPVALKPNEEEEDLERWVSSLEYLTKQQNVEDRHTLQRRGIPVSEPMTNNIPKDVKVYEKLEQILELGMKEDGKVGRILELVQQLVSNQNNLQGIKKRKFLEGHQHMGAVEGEEEEEILDEDYAAAYGTRGPSVESWRD
ncbi:hypothetical protein L1987_32672 [Smallanthus sonchifolius]|uniref:Uncharacterized protein n=1 Tax=Smallanthus sonchifolius TaxID=185202 RepID=A0ACB9HNX4_9ASTR|nr:hypothetical protein L1987_32672 [Smallanthus sonchifolius]